MCKLSIITICYNIKDTIEKTCESIVNQTWQDFEWIVVDGGSTDGTLDILNKYKNRINILISEPDTGVYNAMNKGIKLSTGKYLNFMNGGDSFYDNFVLEKVFTGKEYTAGVLYGDMIHMGCNGEHIIYPDIVTPSFVFKYSICHQASFIKKEIFSKYGLYNEKFRIVSDMEKFVILLNNNETFQHINELVAIYEGGGISSKKGTLLKEKNIVDKKYISNRKYYANKVLIIELNNCHAECLPGYIKYFLLLGYKVDLVLNKCLEEDLPLEMFKNNSDVFVEYLSQATIFKFINSDKVDLYNICLINSNIIYGFGSIFDYIKSLHPRTKFLCVEHIQKNIKELKQRAIPVVLKKFSPNKSVYEINPCYFGDISKHDKNTVTNFIVAGNIQNHRKNFDLLINTIENLIDNNISNFKVTIVGQGNLDICDKLAKYIDIKGRLSYKHLYEELQNSDYFLPLLDPTNIEHNRYITSGTSGSFQLINGFNLPCIIADKFAKVHGYNSTNAIVYNENKDLYKALITAINLSNYDYKNLQVNLSKMQEQIFNNSLENLKRAIKSPKYYLFSKKSFNVLVKMMLRHIFLIENDNSRIILTILGIKIKIKSRKLEQKKRLDNIDKEIKKLCKKISNQNKVIYEQNEKLEIEFQKDISDLRNENDNLKNNQNILYDKLQQKISTLQNENDNLKNELQQKVYLLQNENNNLKNEFRRDIISLRNEFWQNILSLQSENGNLDIIPIFMASDDNYAPFLCSAMYSMLENTNSFINFYILDGGISLKSKNLIKNSLIIFKNYSVEYINMEEFDYSKFPNKRHYSLNTFSRYFIPEFKPDIEKAVYIDCDVIVNGNIAEFYNIDLEDKALIAIPENFYRKNGEYVKEHLVPEFENTENYFNAGVMLLNIKQFIENDYTKILINKTIELADKLSCPDQDIFNIVFEKNHKLADYKYNYMPDFYEKYKKVTNDVENLDNNAIVYHYTCGKPWKNSGEGVRKSELFWNTLKKTAFYQNIEDYKAITLKS